MRKTLFAAAGLVLGLAAAAVCGLARPAALPEAHAQAMAAGSGEVGPVMMGMGGAQQNQNDLCWILFRDKSRAHPTAKRPNPDPFRYSLCLYRVVNNGQAFDLVDVREVSYDFKIVQLNVPGHNPRLTPQAILNFFEDGLKKEADREKENTGKKTENP